MVKSRHFLLLFLPAIAVAMLALWIRVAQLMPKYGDDAADTPTSTLALPILPGDPILGDKKAATTIIAFADFSCPACRQQMSLLHEILAEYPKKVKVIWKGLPVARIPYPSEPIHEYAYCANEQGKFTAFETAIFAETESEFLQAERLPDIATAAGLESRALESCLAGANVKTHIEQTKEIARLFHVQAVPALFINHRQIEAPTSLAGWKTLLNLSL